MRHITLDRTSDGQFSVRVLSGMRGDVRKTFATIAEAEKFALSKIGRSGIIVDLTTMNPEQLAKYRAKIRAMLP